MIAHCHLVTKWRWYEATGNFSGNLVIVYLDNVSGNTLVSDVNLPLSKEITYNSNVIGIGISGQSSVYGVASQTATLKIYSGVTVVKSETVTANNVGQIVNKYTVAWKKMLQVYLD